LFAQVITPVEAPIEPADPLLNDQLYPVLLVAVVAYVVVVVPLVNWQVGSVPADMVMAVGVPTVGVTVTEKDAKEGEEEHPAIAVRVKVAVPLNVLRGVQIAFNVFTSGKNKPPAPLSDQIIAVVPLSVAPPKDDNIPP
jgi:hypothetical protein